MFKKFQILKATPHQHINLKQSLKIEIHKFWVSNMHKICGSRNYIEIVIINSSRYYNMFSYINLGFYQTWDEFLRELPLIHKSPRFDKIQNWCMKTSCNTLNYWLLQFLCNFGIHKFCAYSTSKICGFRFFKKLCF